VCVAVSLTSAEQSELILILLILKSSALYEDGVLLAPKEGAPAEPVACAGNDGTVITVCSDSKHGSWP
jgi:hypothetical protein